MTKDHVANLEKAREHLLEQRRTLAEDAEHRRCDVAERAIGLQAQLIIVGNQDERNGIGGVVGVRAAGFRIDHGFGVAERCPGSIFAKFKIGSGWSASTSVSAPIPTMRSCHPSAARTAYE